MVIFRPIDITDNLLDRPNILLPENKQIGFRNFGNRPYYSFRDPGHICGKTFFFDTVRIIVDPVIAAGMNLQIEPRK